MGSTSRDPLIRTEEHNKGKNYWANLNKPFELIYYEKYECKTDALRRENFYKKGFGQQIKYLIVEFIDRSGIKPKGGSHP